MSDVMDWLINFAKNHEAALGQLLISLATAGLTLAIGFYLVGLLSRLVERLLRARKLDSAVSVFISNLIHYALVVLVVISALAALGVETSTFAAGIAAAGLAIGLALQGSLSHFASGVLIVVFRPFRAGDFIDAGGVTGTVRAIYIFSTELVTADNKVVIIPNAQITSGTITNFSREPRRRVDMVLGVSYSADLKATRAVIEQVVSSHPKVLAEPAPTIGLLALADSAVQFAVRPWCRTEDYWTVHFELHEQLKIAFDAAGVEIPFPQMQVHFDDRTLAVLAKGEKQS